MSDKLEVSPEQMAQTAKLLYEPSDILRDIRRRIPSQDAVRWVCGGKDEEISQSLHKQLPPMAGGLVDIIDTLVIAFDQTAAQTLASSRSFEDSEDQAADLGDNLNSEINGDGSNGTNGTNGRR
ncbi:hypothetical protein [Actinorugispora endophytica]|uniref:Excreted virulence factor EspC (Type VII ESX diderm) n=1 Tax=Actinorugispora endophytica TaxID=1605990 RepID=A0A4R6UI38_9ACTN|nr:hypothetical protein [Actinorugispora endophytica]TDQ44655.1 hypothetical protein EV190_1342 [Actinorugispora endophytica]